MKKPVAKKTTGFFIGVYLNAYDGFKNRAFQVKELM